MPRALTDAYSERPSDRSGQLELVLVGAVVWTAVAVIVWWARGSINFADRDDGIITLSHARHWIEQGSIGVSAFGDRVAGFSTPLHFLVSVPFYLLGGESYELWDRIIGFSSIALVGGLTGLLIGHEERTAPMARRWLELGGALVLQMTSWTFFGWHFSGMENPLTTVLLMAVVAVIPLATRNTRWMALTGVLLGLLAIARLDTITIVVPLVAVVLWSLRGQTRSGWIRNLVALAGPLAVIGIATLGGIYLYFGQLRSTTVDNRNRDLLAVLVLMVLAVVAALVVVRMLRSLAAMTAAACAPDGSGLPGGWRGQLRSREAVQIVGGLLILVVSAAVAVLIADTEVISSTLVVTHATGAMWTAVLVALAWCIGSIRPERLHPFTVVVLWVPLYEFVLGPTRLSLARVVSSAIPVLSVATVVILGRLWAVRRAAAPVIGVPRWASITGLLAVALFGLTLVVDLAGLEPTTQTSYASTFNLCCTIEPRAQILLDAVADVVGEVDPLVTPIIANPDLGKITYRSKVHVVDLGQIGDPLYLEVSTVTDEALRERLIDYYLMEVYTPDLIQVGASWTCDLNPLVITDDFEERYERIDVGSASAPGEGDLDGYEDCGELGEVQNGVYVLRDPSSRPDLALASDLLNDRADVDDEFFAACRDGEAADCFTQMRAFRRAFPGADNVERAEAALANAGDGATGRFVRAAIQSPDDPSWASEAFDALEEIEAANRR